MVHRGLAPTTAAGSLRHHSLWQGPWLAEAQGIEPYGLLNSPSPVLKTGEPTRRSDASTAEGIHLVTLSLNRTVNCHKPCLNRALSVAFFRVWPYDGPTS